MIFPSDSDNAQDQRYHDSDREGDSDGILIPKLPDTVPYSRNYDMVSYDNYERLRHYAM